MPKYDQTQPVFTIQRAIPEAAAQIQVKPRTERRCLCCGKTFLSHGPNNRLCGACRKRDDYMLFAA